MNYNSQFKKRVSRTLSFLEEKKPGSVIWLRKALDYPFEGHWVSRLMKQDVSELADEQLISEWDDIFLQKTRSKYSLLYFMEDDSVPTPEVYFSIGTITSMMSGVPARFVSDTGWCSAQISDWDVLEELKFNPDNIWVKFYTLIIKDMIKRWEGDYCLMPFIHRSPLDAANGLRGDDLLLDCYDKPDHVKNLAMKCAEWSIDFENYLKTEIVWPNELQRGAWGMALPDNCVFVNGDPVDLISSEHQIMFDRPSAGKLFSQTGGGFFHHHALGTRQVKNVAETSGLVVQNVYTDPNVEHPFKQMINDDLIAEMFINASLKAPIYLTGDLSKYIDTLAPILERGCFILEDSNPDGYSISSQKLERFRV